MHFVCSPVKNLHHTVWDNRIDMNECRKMETKSENFVWKTIDVFNR